MEVNVAIVPTSDSPPLPALKSWFDERQDLPFTSRGFDKEEMETFRDMQRIARENPISDPG
jgi:hypothetical protein